MQLAGVRLRPKNGLHLKALKKAWELKRRSREAALQAVLATIGKEPQTAVAAFQDFMEAEHPAVRHYNLSWDQHAKEFMKKKGW